MTDPADGPDPLLALFRREAAAHAGELAEGLAVLAVDRDHPDLFPRLERAAQQIKAAALVAGVAAAADLGRAMEAALAAARQNPAALTPERVADLLEAVELVKAAADAAAEGGAEPPAVTRVAEAVGRLATAGVPLAVSPDRGRPAHPPASHVDHPGTGETSPPGGSEAGGTPAARHDPPPDSALLDLFREEVRTLTAALSGGLVELEATADPRTVEPLMRAAHSIKGAARIVGCDPAVELGHVLEELLVAAQKGTRALTPADIDPMLASVDLLARLGDADPAAWAADHGPRAAEAAAALAKRLSGEAGPGRGCPARPPAPAGEAPATGGASRPVEAQAGGTPAARPDPRPEAADPDDRVVRISAQSLSRLLSLAGESLVEARWLQPFARSLSRLKKYQDHLADVLDDLHQSLAAEADPGRIGAAAEDARRRSADCRRVLVERIDEFEKHAHQSDDLNSRLYREVIASRMRPFADGTHGLARMARDVARQLGKKVRFEVAGTDTDVDRDILDKLEAPLGHLLRNALDHGLESPAERAAAGKPETGTLRVEARHHAGMLDVSVTDDGRGIDLDRLRRKVVERGLTTADMAARLSEQELLEFLFLPGFSTVEHVTDVSGRGVGLDAVQATAQAVGGSVRVATRLGRGTTFELQLPITLSVVRAVLVRIAGDPFAVPLNRTDRLLRLPVERVRTLEGKPHFEADGRHVGLVPAHPVFDLQDPETAADELAVVLIGDRSHQYGLVVDGFLGEQDLVVRPLDPRLGKVPNVAAAALMDDGSPVLILDVDDVVRSAAGLVQEGKLRHRRPAARVRRRKRVLVVDDSAIVREAERQMLQGRGYEVDLAVDGMDGWHAVRTGGYDLVVSDIDMPRMTGLELIRAIRADSRLQSTPVVVVSYKDRDEDQARGLDAGANYYLTKSSFHDGRFLQAVEDLIGGPDAA